MRSPNSVFTKGVPMARTRRALKVLAPVVGLALLLAACGGSKDSDTGKTDGSPAGAAKLKVAALFSGSTTDADYNALGLLALDDAKANLSAKTAFSESVQVPDAERVIREYVADGYNVVWTHGSQFFEATTKVAKENPKVTFIGEFDDQPPAGTPGNVWVVDRNFHTGFYPIGVLAGALTKTGKIGYVGGLSLPFSYSEVHAMNQALKDSGSSATLTPVWTGDFNDPAKAQQITSQLLNQGVDVIVGSLNLGMVGAFQAVKGKSANSVWVTAKYTDKSQFSPDHYASSVIYDFTKPLDDILGKIAGGETSGYYPLGFTTGVAIQTPDNLPADAKQKVEQAVSDVRDGKTTVTKTLTPIK